jgi:serine/threonine-protein kinase
MQRGGALVALACGFFPVAVAGAEDKLTAEATYDRAEELAKQGNFIAACPLYEASFRADPQIGVLLHLADCHERIGRTATAWAEFREAAARAKQHADTREALANEKAARLEQSLARLHVVPPAPLPTGLTVRLDGTDIVGLVDTDMPIDPGPLDLEVGAIGAVTWKRQLVIDAAPATIRIEVPTLDSPSVAPPPDVKVETQAAPAPEHPPEPVAVVPRDEPIPETAPSHLASLTLGAGALVLAGSGLGFELWGGSIYNDAKAEQQDQQRRDNLYQQANTRRYLAEGAAVASLACVGVAVWLYVRGHNRPTTPAAQHSLGVLPTGLVMVGRF